MRFGIDLLLGNIGMQFEWLIVLIFILAAVIVMAKHFQIGDIVLLVSMGAIFVWFHESGYNWAIPLVVFFISLISLALSLYGTDATSMTGGFG